MHNQHYYTQQETELKSLSRVQLFAIPWTVAYYAPPSMGFSRQEYCSGLPFPSPITSGQIDGETVEQCVTSFWGAPKSLQMMTAAMKLKDAYSLEGKL